MSSITLMQIISLDGNLRLDIIILSSHGERQAMWVQVLGYPHLTAAKIFCNKSSSIFT